jgi:hypothetical protein
MDRGPNLLFIYTDEQAHRTMAAYGNPRIETPNLNRLAAESLVFERAYVTQPVCTPSRSSLLTGLYPHTNECTANNVPFSPDTPCLPEMAEVGSSYPRYDALPGGAPRRGGPGEGTQAHLARDPPRPAGRASSPSGHPRGFCLPIVRAARSPAARCIAPADHFLHTPSRNYSGTRRFLPGKLPIVGPAGFRQPYRRASKWASTSALI